MRAIVVVLCLLVTRIAHANTIVVLASSHDLDEALRVTLAGRGTAVANASAPAGDLRVDRAAAAQRIAVQSGAQVAVWIDDGEICAVTSDGRDFRHAPYPDQAASPRAFAAIATSLLDEMIAPASWAQNLAVDVHVNVTPTSVVATTARPPSPRRGRMLFELGVSLDPLPAMGGIEGGTAAPLSRSWRLAATGGIVVGRNASDAVVVGGAALELRHVGAGDRAHWDFGPTVGYMDAIGDSMTDAFMFGGVRIARTWELASGALSVSVTPGMWWEVSTPGIHPKIGLLGSVRWQFSL